MKNKYNIGDTAFFIDEKKVASKEITMIFIIKDKVFYGFKIHYLGEKLELNGLNPEKDLFKTKKELLASL